ncbi:MarR family transcriptional regulator [Halobaculum sp. EA56]|uniref:MarR family transcriptional regulator n=1 Tax=Halobaculum sp. EA56 TaxID=3421648 RepID=UPI003EB75CF8
MTEGEGTEEDSNRYRVTSEKLSDAEKAWYSEDEDDYDWLTDVDMEILDVLMYSELVLTPTVIADNIGRSRSSVSRRLNALQAGGLVEKEGRGKYRISELGAGLLMSGIVLPEREWGSS